MKYTLVVGDLHVDRGRRVTEVMHASIAGQAVPVPVIAINGAHDGPRVAVTAGVHGAEYVGIEAARRLGMDLDPADVHGSVVVVPIVNTTSFHRRAIYTSGLDDRNLNRMFPGKADGVPSEALADWIFRTIIEPSDYFVDLHGGDMIEALVPFAIYLAADDAKVEQTSLEMASATGIPRIIRGLTPGSTYAAATAAGIPSILAEIGGQGVWSNELVELHRESTLGVLRYLGVLDGEAPARGDQRRYDTFAWMRADVDGLFLPGIGVGDTVREGQAIGRIADYFGNDLQQLTAATSGEIIFLVTSLAINAGDPLLAIVA